MTLISFLNKNREILNLSYISRAAGYKKAGALAIGIKSGYISIEKQQRILGILQTLKTDISVISLKLQSKIDL